jgi:antitoxin VapB
MMTAKLIANGGSQAVRLPKSCRFEGSEVLVNKVGDAVVLVPADVDVLDSMTAAAGFFTDDFMEQVEDLPLQEKGGAL